ncbi:hypothetical protein ISS05_03330 [Candidatus Woesearchaeota archaeon]|nr:hypothetical protein [Candidatus Woesearchaeota archaeon]
MKKRGEVNLWFLIEVIAAFFIGWILINASTAYAKGTVYEKVHIAKNLAMEINALASVPGSAYILNSELYNYSVHIFDDKVVVYEHYEEEPSRGEYDFTGLGEATAIDFKEPEQIVISKINGTILSSEHTPDTGTTNKNENPKTV